MKSIEDIQKLRKKHNLTQKELANNAVVSQSLIAKIEAKKIEPTYSKVKRIFEALEEVENKKELKAKDLMKTKVCFSQANDSIKETIKIMKKRGISQLPVLDKDKAVGIITEGTILKQIINQPEKVNTAKVKEIMEDAPPIVSFKTGIRTLLELLRDFPIILVSEKGEIKGIISKTDLLNKVE